MWQPVQANCLNSLNFWVAPHIPLKMVKKKLAKVAA
jgi:hypothetical protein